MSNEKKQTIAKIDKRAYALLAAATALCAALYLAWPHAGFVFDDSVTILHNRLVQESPVSAIRENPFRSAVNLTFWLQHRLSRPALAPLPLAQALPGIRRDGGERLRPEYLDPDTGAVVPVTIDLERGMVYPLPPSWPFHLFNLALHLLNGWLLFYILRRLNAAPALAAAGASAFLLHPLATEPVDYITARFALMALTFSLAATLAHLRADGRDARARGRGELAALGFYILALLSKETAAALPLMLFVLDLARGRWRPLPLAGLAALAVYAAARSQWMVVLGARPGDVLDWPTYLLAQQRVFWLYLGKVALPVRLNFDYHLISRPATDAAFALANLALAGAASFRLLQLLARLHPIGPSRNKTPVPAPGPAPADAAAAAFLLCWMALAPTSTVIPLADLAREDRAYPMLAILIPAAGFGLARLFAGAPRLRRLAIGLAAAIIGLLAAGTAARNQVWQTELSLQRDTVRQSPDKPRAVYNYATALKWRGRLSEALHWYDRTLELDPTHRDARINADTLRRLLASPAPTAPPPLP